MKRSKKKGPFTILLNKTNIENENLTVFKRSFEITSNLVGLNCQVYNGKNLIKITIAEAMVGHKFGEFASTRGVFVFKKKKKNKMGQKINPNILRLGIIKSWKTEFFEKTQKELPRYTYKDLELKTYIERFLDNKGIFLHDYRQNFYNNYSLNLYVSYFITPQFLTKINKKKITKILLINQKGEKKLIIKINNFHTNNIFVRTKSTKNLFGSFKSKVDVTKINKYLLFNNYMKFFLMKYNFNKKFKKINKGLTINFLKAINLFTANNCNVTVNFSCLNKELKLKTTNFKIKKLIFKLKRFRNTDFFKNGIELLLNSVANKNSAHLLAKFIAFHIKTNKRHKFFLSFFKKVFTPLLASNFSVLKGIKIKVKGRLNGAPKSKRKLITIGDVPAQSIKAFVDYSHCAVHNKNGTYGIKVWVAS